MSSSHGESFVLHSCLVQDPSPLSLNTVPRNSYYIECFRDFNVRLRLELLAVKGHIAPHGAKQDALMPPQTLLNSLVNSNLVKPHMDRNAITIALVLNPWLSNRSRWFFPVAQQFDDNQKKSCLILIQEESLSSTKSENKGGYDYHLCSRAVLEQILHMVALQMIHLCRLEVFKTDCRDLSRNHFG